MPGGSASSGSSTRPCATPPEKETRTIPPRSTMHVSMSPATADDLGIAQVRDVVEELQRVQPLRRQEAELVRPAMGQPERQRGSAMEDEPARRRPKLREQALLMVGESVQQRLKQEMPPG